MVTFSTKGNLDLAMVTGRYSAGLASELDAVVEKRSANIFRIIDEIRALEGAKPNRPSNTKPATEFHRPMLKGLFHKHHTQASFMLRNIQNHWTRRRRSQLAKDVLSEPSLSVADLARRLSDKIVREGYLTRSQSRELTGEWIVFAKQEDVAYYLTLASHDDLDDVIWRRCKACASEFPALRILQEDRG
jgi:hypothetical protein